MTELIPWYREGLASRLRALETVRPGLILEEAEARTAAQRLAGNLHDFAHANDLPAVTRAAQRLRDATDGQLVPALDGLLDALRASTAEDGAAPAVILVIEDDTLTAKLLEQALSGPGRQVLVAGSVARAEELLRDHHVALILLDLVLPDEDGRHLLARLRARPTTAATPVFVLSARSGPQPKTESFALGADAYFEKPVELDAVIVAVAARLQRSGAAGQDGRHDPQTGLPNRAGFYEAFDRMRALAVRRGAPMALALLDLDNLRWVNDRWGTPTGDLVLKRAAVVLATSLRDGDLVARWTGGRFMVLFADTDRPGAEHALGKALTRLSEDVFRSPDGEAFHVSFSAGAIEVFAGVPVDDHIQQTVRLVARAKHEGRGRVVAGDMDVVPPKSRILLAEDDPYVASAVVRRLAREGFEVLHFADGAAALDGATAGAVSLVISDIDMPKMDGFELVRRLRLLPAYARIPIVMLTSLGSEEHVVRAFELGADDYILKPFSSPELIARVRRLISLQR